jgi:peptide/nickel transport system permease protein
MSIAVSEPAIARRPSLATRVLGTRALVLGLLLTGVVVALAVLAPLIARYDPLAQDPLHGLQGPSSAHWLGTDQLGRDTLSRLLHAARTDLKVGFLAVLFPFAFGTLVGTLAGYYGGWLDAVVGRVVDIVIAFPFYVLVVALVFVVGAGTKGIYVALGLVDWVVYARTVRASTLVARRLDWAAAARAGGLGDPRILLRHILPNTITQAIVYLMSDIVLVIGAVITLSYLGLGIAPPTPDWGTMIADGQTFLTTKWWLATIPGLAVVITGLGLSLVGDGLADLLRPR